MEENAFLGTFSQTVLIPFGNYSYSELDTLIQNQLNAASSTLTAKPYTVSYNTSNNKISISCDTSTSTVVDFKLLFSTQYLNQPDYKKLSTIMGFNDIDYTSSTVALNIQAITSPLTANLSGGMNLYIKSDTLTYQNMNFFNNRVNNVICGFPVTAAANSIIMWEDQQLLQQRFRATLCNIMNFQLVDEYDNLIDLNGLDWSAVICFYSDLV